MEVAKQLDLERRIQAFLCDGLGHEETLRVLEEIAHDGPARRMLGEMVSMERDARAAFGYDAAKGAMKASCAALLRWLKEEAAEGRRGSLSANGSDG